MEAVQSCPSSPSYPSDSASLSSFSSSSSTSSHTSFSRHSTLSAKANDRDHDVVPYLIQLAQHSPEGANSLRALTISGLEKKHPIAIRPHEMIELLSLFPCLESLTLVHVQFQPSYPFASIPPTKLVLSELIIAADEVPNDPVYLIDFLSIFSHVTKLVIDSFKSSTYDKFPTEYYPVNRVEVLSITLYSSHSESQLWDGLSNCLNSSRYPIDTIQAYPKHVGEIRSLGRILRNHRVRQLIYGTMAQSHCKTSFPTLPELSNLSLSSSTLQTLHFDLGVSQTPTPHAEYVRNINTVLSLASSLPPSLENFTLLFHDSQSSEASQAPTAFVDIVQSHTIDFESADVYFNLLPNLKSVMMVMDDWVSDRAQSPRSLQSVDEFRRDPNGDHGGYAKVLTGDAAEILKRRMSRLSGKGVLFPVRVKEDPSGEMSDGGSIDL